MAVEIAIDNECHYTHFWIDCPGCGYGGKMGLPLDYPAEVVVCPSCREVVRIKPQDCVLWQPADPVDFLRRRFPTIDWESIDETGPTSGAAKQESRQVESSPTVLTPALSRRERRSIARPMASRVLDNHVVQAGLMLAGFFLPLAITLLTLPRLPQRGGEQVAAAAPDATAPERKTAPTQQPPAADTGTADTPGTTKPAEKQPAVVAAFHRAKKRLAKGDYMAAFAISTTSSPPSPTLPGAVSIARALITEWATRPRR